MSYRHFTETYAKPHALTWSNSIAVWWWFLALVSLFNIACWFALYWQIQKSAGGGDGGPASTHIMLFLCAVYVFGCAFRSFLPRADVQRICLFDTWLSSVVVGRSVATFAEVSFALQWAIALHHLGKMTDATPALIAAWLVVPLIVIAQCFSWYGVLTKNFLANAIENSIWAVAFSIVGIALCWLVPEFQGAVRNALVVAIAGTAGFLAFLITVDVPMYWIRWRADIANGSRLLSPIDGLRDVRRRWIVTRDPVAWKGEIAWMSLYFSVAVWSSLALSAFYSLEDQLPRYRAEVVNPPTISASADR